MHLKRKLTIGLFSSLFIIIYYIFLIFNDTPESSTNQENETRQIITLLLFNVFNISIWIVLRDLMVTAYNQSHLSLDFTWFLSLLIILPIALILFILYKSPVIFYILITIGIAEIIFLIRLLLKFTRIQKFEIPNIEFLKNFSISVLLVLIISIALELIRALKNLDKFEKISDSLLIIPYIFLALFFNKERKQVTS